MWPLARLVFIFQQTIQLNDKCHHLNGVFFITDLLGDATPISRLWGHGKPPFYFLISLKLLWIVNRSLSNIALHCTSYYSRLED
jgi:hypothetical protein